MYICSAFKYITKNNTLDEYKKLIKTSCSKSFRRISKFNAMAIYGATKTLKDIEFDKNLNIYTATENGCVESMINVLKQVTNKENVTPFDFLNINGNNVGFLISEAIESIGNNFVITAEDLSFEKALELGYFDLQSDIANEILIGGVDESLDYLENYNDYITNMQNREINDGSVWFYISKDNKNAIAKIQEYKYFQNIETLNIFLKDLTYDNLSLNDFASSFIDLINIDKSKLIEDGNEFFGTYSSLKIHSLLDKDGVSLYIGCDKNKKAYALVLNKE